MNLAIKETVGETTLEFNMSGDYEEVLALVTEIGYCEDVVSKPDLTVNISTDKEQIISEFVKSKCYNCKYE